MNTLTELLSSQVKAEVFRLLFGIGPVELHVREISRRSGLADGTVRQELRRLSGLGLVEARPDGNRTCYRANRQHPLYPDIRNLVLKTSGLVDVLRESLQLPGIEVALIFGSVAGATEKPESDIDLLVVGSTTLRRLSRPLAEASEALGREVNPVVMARDEFARRRLTRDHFLTTVLDGPKLFVIGDEHVLAGVGP